MLVLSVIAVQLFSFLKIDCVHDDVTMNRAGVGVGSDHTFMARKEFSRQGFGKFVMCRSCHFICTIARKFEVIILPFVIPHTFAEPLCCFLKLLGIAPAIIKILAGHDCCFIFVCDIINRFSRPALAALPFE